LDAENLGVLQGSGARGVCVVSAIMGSPDPGAAARLLRARAAAACGLPEACCGNLKESLSKDGCGSC
jgi:hypothetical protein